MRTIVIATALSFLCLFSQTQNVGIGITTPIARLHVADSAVLFSGPITLTTTTKYKPPVQGAGTRMMWYPQKAAFRVGTVNGTQWDKDNIGLYSFVTGYNSIASFNNCIAMGYNNTASNNSSIAIGNSNISNGSSSIIIGSFNSTNADFAKVLGTNTQANSAYETIAGRWNKTDGNFTNSWVPTDRLFVIGNGSDAANKADAFVVLKNGNTGIGTSAPNAPLQLATTLANRKIVLYEVADNDHQFQGFGMNFGALRYQVNQTGDDHIFYAGTSPTTSNQLMRIQGNGNAILAGTLTQNSDVRLKTNIHPLSSSLQNLQQLNGYTYNWIDKTRDNDLQVGLLAQEVQKIYPQLVKTAADGTLSVNYSGLVPVLIEGMKDQQKQIDELKQLIKTLIKNKN